MQDFKTYQEAVDYVLSIPKFTKKNTLQDTREFFEFLGCPGEAAKIIHVAGTNGKGSVCAYLDSILRQAGYKTGLFTSPHLVDIRERFVINGCLIQEKVFLSLCRQIYEKVCSFSCRKGKENYHPTFFEWMFFVAMLFFEQETCEYILLETGLGGRLDTTNVVKKPALTVITKIAFDHMEYLGNTLGEIAYEKAGIIKEGVPLVYLKGEKEVDTVLEETARNRHVSATAVSESDVKFLHFTNKTVDFSMESEYYGYIEVKLHTPGIYQRQNAALAVRAAQILGRDGVLTKDQIQQGLEKMQWQARMEEIRPGVFLDGAHNEDGIRAFLESVQKDGCKGRRLLLFGAVADKKTEEMTALLADSHFFANVFFAPVDSERSLKKEQLLKLWERFPILHPKPFEDVTQALRAVLSEQGEKDFVYIAGSLYLAGEIKLKIQDMEVNHDKF